MNKRIKRALSLLIGTLTLVSFAGCSKVGQNEKAVSASIAVDKQAEAAKADAEQEASKGNIQEDAEKAAEGNIINTSETSKDNKTAGTSNKPEETKASEQVKASKKVKVSEENIEDDTEYIASKFRIPVISGLENKAIETKLNDMFKEEALNHKAEIEKIAKENFEVSKKDKEIPFLKHGAGSDYTVRYNKNNILSITMELSQYTGGAHGGAVKIGYNIDLKTGKILLLPDIFEEGFDYKGVISSEILKAIEKDKNAYFQGAAATVKGINENRPYYIEDGNIVIYFGQYEIAPYAAGMPEFKIPFSKLKLKSDL